MSCNGHILLTPVELCNLKVRDTIADSRCVCTIPKTEENDEVTVIMPLEHCNRYMAVSIDNYEQLKDEADMYFRELEECRAQN